MIQTSFFPQPEKDVPIQIIQKIDASGLHAKKLEDVAPNKNLPKDTYIIYPTGGTHMFFGVPNTFPLYQLPIWPYVKRVKFENPKSRGRSLNLSQLNCDFNNGYPRLNFRTNNHKWWDRPMHRLVALAFIPNPDNKPYVMHINDDSTNYLIENLMWGTSHENNKGKIVRRPDTTEQKYLDFVNKGIIKG